MQKGKRECQRNRALSIQSGILYLREKKINIVGVYDGGHHSKHANKTAHRVVSFFPLNSTIFYL
jgi:hypothetical protein